VYVVGVEASGEIREAAEWACVLLSRPNIQLPLSVCSRLLLLR